MHTTLGASTNPPPPLPTHQVIEELKKLGRGDIVVVCGGVIPPQDYQLLYNAGVAAVYSPGTNIPHAAYDLVELIERNLDGPSRASGLV